MDPHNRNEVPYIGNDGQAVFEANIAQGRIVISKLIKKRSKGIGLELQWNEKGNPIGLNAS